MTDRTVQLRVRYHDDPQFTTSFGDDCLVLVWRHGDLTPADNIDGEAFVLTVKSALDLAEMLVKTVGGYADHRAMVDDIDSIQPDDNDGPEE